MVVVIAVTASVVVMVVVVAALLQLLQLSPRLPPSLLLRLNIYLVLTGLSLHPQLRRVRQYSDILSLSTFTQWP